MSTIRSHKDLIVWQNSMVLACSVYEITKSFLREERFGLAQQMRRAAVSIAGNIAEGAARKHRTEFLQFLHIARGSLAELETQTQIALSLKYVSANTNILCRVQDVGRLLTALLQSLQVRIPSD